MLLSQSTRGLTIMLTKCLSLCVLILFAGSASRAADRKQTVVYDGSPTEVVGQDVPAKDLWVTMNDLTRATRFVVKPQGVCRDELCFPLPKARKSEFVSKKGNVSWFNLSEFARLVKQPVAHDDKDGVWYFGKREDERGAYLTSLE